MTIVLKFLKSDSGATAIEYALIATLLSVAIIGGATAVGNNVGNGLDDAANALQSI